MPLSVRLERRAKPFSVRFRQRALVAFTTAIRQRIFPGDP
jgi:hypothetical protein